jgi:hypothetical protein
MESQFGKLSLYDFLGFIVPGIVTLAILYWFCTGFLVIVPSLGQVKPPESLSLIVFFASSYFLGHVLQTVGAEVQRRRQRRGEIPFPETYLQMDDSHYSPAYKQKIIGVIDRTFELSKGSTQATPSRQELFHLCSVLIGQTQLGERTTALFAICALYRGLFVAAWISGSICLLIAVKSALLGLLPRLGVILPAGPFWAFNLGRLLLAAVLAIIFFYSVRWVKRRWDQYIHYYVDSVYTNLYLWHQTEKEEEIQKTA